ncbi:MAG: ribonuclease P protein subunit [Candidatus Hadarchaeales archaeon]
MKISEKDIAKHELIGLKVKILTSSCRSLIGLEGKIIDESKKMIVLETKNGPKKIPKETSVFFLTLPDGKEIKLEGRRIVGRP